MKLEDKEKIELYPLFQSVETGWKGYSNAVELKNDQVTEEVWHRRSGPRGKSLVALQKEQENLEKQINDLLKRQQEEKLDTEIFLKLVKPLNRQLDKIEDKLRRDYEQ